MVIHILELPLRCKAQIDRLLLTYKMFYSSGTTRLRDYVFGNQEPPDVLTVELLAVFDVLHDASKNLQVLHKLQYIPTGKWRCAYYEPPTLTQSQGR